MPDTDVDQELVDHEVTAEPERRRTQFLRNLVVRQLDVSHDLGSELVDAATNASVAVAHGPAAVIDEIRGGATLPTAFAQSGTAVREVIMGTGATLRTAIGDYVGHQATLPNAVVVAVSEVAESVLRAQGRVTATTINATFAVAATVVHGGHLRESVSRERRTVGLTTDVGREAVGESWDRALEEIRGAVQVMDTAGFEDEAAAFAEPGLAR